MANLKSILSEIEELGQLKNVTTAYEEISTMKMQKIRASVLTNREFIDALTKIYQELTMSYRNQILEMLKNKKGAESISVRKQNGRIACVYLSANSGLFGAIMKRTYLEFAAYIQKYDVDPVIVGEYGKGMFTNEFPNRPFTFFELEKDTIPVEVFQKITEKLLPYQNIIIFYTRFNSMSSQSVAMLDVAGERKKSTMTAEIKLSEYFFEPSLEEILAFFEQEIFANIIEQNFTDSELSRNAYRILTLDAASKNIENRIKMVELDRKLAIHRIMNKKQTEALSGISLWKLV